MVNIFMSHSTMDKDLANYLCNAFEERGLSCWIAPRDIIPGEEWAVSISNAIAESDVLFVLFSQNSNKSSQVTKEIGIADRKGKYILPYKIDDTEPEGAFDYYLTGCQWVVVNPESGDYKIDEICKIVRNVIKERESREAGAIQEQANSGSGVLSEHPIPSMPIKEASSPAQLSKPSAPKKTKKKWLLAGGMIFAGFLLIVVGIVLVVAAIIGLNGEGVQSLGQGSLTSLFQTADTDDFNYEVSDGSVTITGYNGEDTDIVIPGEIHNLPVKYISEKIFYCDANITSVVIPEGVMEVPKYAFYKCTNLSSVTIPNSVVLIGENAFEGCTGLTQIVLPDNVNIIDDFAFYKCSNLSSVTIPDSVIIIGEHSFDGCTGLSQIILPDSVNIIGDFAFYSCTGMTDLRMGNSVSVIGNYAFATCEELAQIQLPDSVDTIGNMAFAYCTKLTEITIPEDILTISESAFSGCLTITVYYKDDVYSYDISELIAQLNSSNT